MISQRIFVVGYMHSGTTLLLQVLRRNRQLLGSGGETKYFDSLPMLKQSFPNLNDDATLRSCIAFTAGVIYSGGAIGSELGRHGLWVREDYPDAKELIERIWESARMNRRYGAIFRLVFDEMACNAKRSGWIEKTPTHVYHLKTILQDIPDARFVEIVRDPRDILASKKKRRHDVWDSERYRSEQRPLKHLEKGYDPLWDTLAWKSAVRASAGVRRTRPAQIRRIRYEDLVTDPETEVQRLCTFLDLPYQSSMLEVTYRISADIGHTGHQRGITADAVGRWQRTLNPGEVAVCQLATERDLVSLGYRPAPRSLSAQVAVPFILFRSVVEFGQRLYRKGRLAGAGYVWNVLVNYGKRLRHLLHQS